MVPDSLRTALIAVTLGSLLVLSSVATGAGAVSSQPTTVEQPTQATQSTATDAADSPPTDGEVVETFTDRMASLDTVVMTYEMNMTFDSDRTSSVENRLWIDAENDRVRTETNSERMETITVSNESETVTYDVENNQVSRFDHTGETGPQTSIDQLITENEFAYEGQETIDGEATYRLDMTPTESNTMADSADTTLWIDTDTYFPTKLTRDASGENYEYEMVMDIRNVSLNEPIADDRFTIDIPADADTPDNSPLDRTTYDSLSELRADTTQSVPSPAVPEGYHFAEGSVIENTDFSMLSLQYVTDGDDVFHVTKRHHSATGGNYDELDRYEAVEVGDHTGYYAEFEFEGTTTSVLNVNCDSTKYSVSGDLSKEESIEVAESLTCE
ncbi:DUF4367 domain-containing protein [Natrinema gari]|uniref:DUF4367 domain-containing protein n=1 Tax=Natrinema gari JCM 14663 TaxID=1230459 RepID=L9ZEC6_9EURY|nr:DUF4367 domain-containing protein [Natrinema gari]ELY83947.1 hypothetical protein C486_01929 [Natrinema gari JCM 14663]